MSNTKLCFFCGGNQDLMVQYSLGGEYTGAADHACQWCRNLIGANQVGIFEVTEQDPGHDVKFNERVWYTGRWVTVGKQYLKNLFVPEVAAKVAEAGAGVLNNHTYRANRLDTYCVGILQ